VISQPRSTPVLTRNASTVDEYAREYDKAPKKPAFLMGHVHA